MDELKEKQTHSKLKKSRINTFTGIYLVFVLLLAVLIVNLWGYIWRECASYQENSATTILDSECSRLSEYTGEELSYKLISKTGESEDEFIYTLKSGSEKVADVYLKKTKTGFMGLAHYELVKTLGLRSYEIIYPNGSVVYFNNEKYDGESSSYSLAGQEVLDSIGTTKYSKMTVTEAFCIKDIEVKQDGSDTALVLEPQSGGEYFACSYLTGDEGKNAQQAAVTYSKHYSLYMFQEYEFWTLYNETYPGSAFIWNIYDSKLYYQGEHEATRIENIKVSEALDLGNDVCIVNVTFDFILTLSSKDTLYEIEFESILRKDYFGNWKVTNQNSSIIEEMELAAWNE